jgi:hypothetical protein
MSIFMPDMFVEENYASGSLVVENSEPLLCRLEDGAVFKFRQINVNISWRLTDEVSY